MKVTTGHCYLAPSRQGYGWGVFALRSFQQGDIVDVAPMFLLLDLEDNRAKIVKETVLNNYHYEYWAWDGIQGVTNRYSMISFGMTLYYNHQSSPDDINSKAGPPSPRRRGPNIEQRKIGREPDMECFDRGVAIIYYALRDIEEGEELLVDYGGSNWFKGRGMEEIISDNPNETTTSQHQELENQHDFMRKLSGKVLYGYHQDAYHRVLKYLNEEFQEVQPFQLETILPFLPTQKVCFGQVRAQSLFQPGDTIEYVPVLLLPRNLVRSTLLEPLAIDWEDMDELSRTFQNNHGRPDRVMVQYQPDLEDTATISTKIDLSTNESVFLALAGSISMMARACKADKMAQYNAKLQIEDDMYNPDGYCIRVVACQPISPGERIILGVSKAEVVTEDITQELCIRGQPFEAC